MLISGSINDIPKTRCDEVWVIVRNLKGGMPHSEVPIKHVPELSPSEKLYSDYWKYKKALKWTQRRFDEWYKPIFLKEMEGPAASKMLDKLAAESREKDILIVCFCPNESICHRSLVKKLVEKRLDET